MWLGEGAVEGMWRGSPCGWGKVRWRACGVAHHMVGEGAVEVLLDLRAIRLAHVHPLAQHLRVVLRGRHAHAYITRTHTVSTTKA
eukprot:6625290-Prymnesium_polylepis.1